LTTIARLLTSAALASLLAAASASAAGPSAMRILHVTLDPGNYIDAATTVDSTGMPAFIFGTGDIPPVSATSYDGAGNLRWSFFNKSAGKDIKLFETTSARHCESAGKGAGAVDVFVTEADAFNDAGFTVFALSSAAESAAPVRTLPFPGCYSQDGGYTTAASDTGARIVVQADCPGSRGTAFGVNGQTGEIDWRYNTTNPLSGTDMNVKISANGEWVLYIDAYAPDTPNNATVLAGATGEVRDSSIPLPYYSQSAAISDSGNYVAIVDEIAVNVYKWRASLSKYQLAYVLAPPPGTVASGIDSVVMSTGRDKDEMIVALYDTGAGDARGVAVGIWSLVSAQLLTTWQRQPAGTFGGMSADGDYVSVPLDDGAVVLKRGSNEEVFSFKADTMFKTSINVLRSSSGTSDTVFLATAGGNNGGNGNGNTGDAYAYSIDVPDAAAPAAAPPCFGTFNGDTPLEELCFTTLLNSTVTPGLSVREYPAATADAARLVSYNVSAIYPVDSYMEALSLGGFGVIEYFIGGFNKKKQDLLDARTVPFLVLPPAAAGGWVARLAVAPSKFPDGAKLPEPTNNVTITSLGGAPVKGVPLTLAVLHTGIKGSDAPTGAQLAAICTRAQSEIGAGALPGYKVDAASPYAEGIYALYYGRDAPQGVTYVAECWIGVAASA
jgi:hypothetical protein